MSFTSCISNNTKSFGTDYEKFLDRSGGFPVSDKNGGWVIKKDYKQSYKTSSEYFNLLAQEIVKNGTDLLAKISNPDKFVSRINEIWTKERLPVVRSKTAPDRILFSSKAPEYEWLSNFYPTLIYDEASKRLYYCVETAYQALKNKEADKETFDKLATCVEPIKAKKLAKNPTDDEEEIQKRIELMDRLAHLKFSQNAVLKERLSQTQSAQLIEHTDSKIWGDGSDGSGQNQLGKILEKVRTDSK